MLFRSKSASASESPFAKDVPIAPTQVGNGVHNPGTTIPAHTPVTPSNTNQPAATHQTPNPNIAVPPVANPSVNPTAPRISSSATPADPVVKPIPTLVTPGASTTEPIRGVAARVVQSMEASLAVPTATSVRAIPAKLMIDNRTVINNHLKRARGGKVSFTHIIGYAMIKAIRQMPEMNKIGRAHV